jgi:gliding motility-associated-like protein
MNDSVNVSPSSSGLTTYTVTGEALGCAAIQTVTVNVTTTPTLAATSTPGTVCAGDTAFLVATGATTYTWSSNAGSAINDTAIVTPLSPPNITYTVIGANGICSDTTTVTVNVKPRPTVTPVANPTQICQGETAILSATGPATSYTWTPTNTVNDSLLAHPTQTTTYVVVGDMNGCTGVAVITLTVNPVPTINSVSGQTVCAGGQVQPITFSGTAGATYNWTNNGVLIGLGASGTGSIGGYTAPSVATQQTGTITVTPSFTTTGCTGSSQSFVIIINPTPSISGGVPDTARCGLPIGGVHGITVSGGTAPTIQWVGPTGTVAGATTTTLTGVPAGTYTIVVTDANNCSAVGTPTVFVVPGTIQPIAGIAPSTLGGQAPLNVSFANTSVGASSYYWNLGNGTNVTTTTAATTYTMSGTYTVTLIAYNAGCLDVDTVLILVNDATTIAVPNIFSPNGDNINDEFYIVTTGMQTLRCDIFNRWGQKVYTLSTPTQKWDGKLDNGNEATEGTYFYVLEALGYDGKTYSYKGPITLVK